MGDFKRLTKIQALLVLLTSILVIPAVPISASPQEVTITVDADQDAYVDEFVPAGTNNLATLKVGSLAKGNVWTFVDFPVDSVDLPYGTIESAEVKLYEEAVSSARTYGIYEVTGAAWAEGTLTWTNKPSTAAAAEDTAGAGTAVGFVSWDVTDLVKANLESNKDHRLMIRDEAQGAKKPGVFTTFTSSEGAEAQRPVLEITIELINTFSLEMTPSEAGVLPGETAVFEITLSAVNNFVDTVDITVDATQLKRAVANENNDIVLSNAQVELVPGDSETITLTVVTTAEAKIREYEFEVTGVGQVTGETVSVDGALILLSSPVTRSLPPISEAPIPGDGLDIEISYDSDVLIGGVVVMLITENLPAYLIYDDGNSEDPADFSVVDEGQENDLLDDVTTLKWLIYDDEGLDDFTLSYAVTYVVPDGEPPAEIVLAGTFKASTTDGITFEGLVEGEDTLSTLIGTLLGPWDDDEVVDDDEIIDVVVAWMTGEIGLTDDDLLAYIVLWVETG